MYTKDMERILNYTASSADEGKSILTFLREHGYSRQNITALKKMHESILRNGIWEYVSCTLREGDVLTVQIRETEGAKGLVPVPLPFPIVYEDEDLVIVNKPADMPIHPSIHNYDNTLANAAAWYYAQRGIPFTFRCINRLDRDTTGLTIVAKHMLSAGILSEMVARREIHREYLALIGLGESDAFAKSGTVDAPIARMADSIIERCVDFVRGERAVTHYRVIEEKNGCALLSLRLETGRTHQIRVHMKYLGHPLLGDSLYGGDLSRIQRQALHSHQLSLLHPITGEPLRFTAPLPEDMGRLVTG